MSSKGRQSKPRITRRRFLRASALGTGAAVSLTGCGSKEEKLIPLLVSEESIIPGTDRWTPSTCTLCPGACGILVRSMQGEAKVQHEGREYRQMIVQVKKVEGNPSHPINLGRLCARGQALPQIPYHPDRIRTPLKRVGDRGTGKYQAISWDEALTLLETKLEPFFAEPAAPGLAAFAGVSGSRHGLLAQFVPAARIGIKEAPCHQTLRRANWQIYDRPELEVHDLENTRYLLSFGAGLLEAHTSPVRYSLGLAYLRGGTGGRKAKFVQVESRFSLTAAQADEWIPVRPGAEGALALSMAHVILKEQLSDAASIRSRTVGFEEYRDRVLNRYLPEVIAKQADVPAEKIIRLAREFAGNQPGIALAGDSALAHPHGIFTAAAVQSLNALVGDQGRAGGISWTRLDFPDSIMTIEAPTQTADELLSTGDPIQALLLWDADPVYDGPAASGIRRKLEKIPFIAASTTMFDDTSVYADLVLPDQTSMEKWGLTGAELTRGQRIISVCQPVIKPMYESRDFADVLLTLAARIGGKLKETLPYETFEDYQKHDLEFWEVLGRGSFVAADFAGFWDKLLEEGVWVDSTQHNRIKKACLSAVFKPEAAVGAERESTEFPLYLQPFASVGFGFGRSAHLPWLQELPDPMTSVAWGSWAEINPRTAAQLNIRDGEVISVESRHGRIEVPALFTPASRPDTVSIPFGQGHRGYGRYAAGRGVNPWEIIAPDHVKGTGDWAWAATRVRVGGTGKMGRLIKIG